MPGSTGLDCMLRRARQRALQFGRQVDEDAVRSQWKKYNGIEDEDEDISGTGSSTSGTGGSSSSSSSSTGGSSNNSCNSGNIGSQRPKSPPMPPRCKLLPLVAKAPPARRRSRSPIAAAHHQYVEEWVLYINLKIDTPPPPASTESRQIAAKVLQERGYDISRISDFESL